MGTKIVMHQAMGNDINLIQGILKQTAQWLKSIGSTQWSEILEGKDNHNTSLAIERGEVYYATVDNKVAGMFILWNKQSNWDKEMWGYDRNQEWLYLHRVNIVRKYAGTTVVQQMIEEAKQIAIKKQAKGIRLDCMSEKNYLNNLYQESGFSFVKKIEEYDMGMETADFNLYDYSLI